MCAAHVKTDSHAERSKSASHAESTKSNLLTECMKSASHVVLDSDLSAAQEV